MRGCKSCADSVQPTKPTKGGTGRTHGSSLTSPATHPHHRSKSGEPANGSGPSSPLTSRTPGSLYRPRVCAIFRIIITHNRPPRAPPHPPLATR
eukprot:5165206-Pyramimonas_sp.AAC.1